MSQGNLLDSLFEERFEDLFDPEFQPIFGKFPSHEEVVARYESTGSRLKFSTWALAINRKCIKWLNTHYVPESHKIVVMPSLREALGIKLELHRAKNRQKARK